MTYLEFLGAGSDGSNDLSLLGNLRDTGWYNERLGMDAADTFEPSDEDLADVLGSPSSFPSSFRQSGDIMAFVRRTITQVCPSSCFPCYPLVRLALASLLPLQLQTETQGHRERRPARTW